MTQPQNLLVENCLKGDRKHQKALYNYYSPKLFSRCLFYTQNQTEAEEVFQEAITGLFNNLHTFNGEEPLDDWIRRNFANLIINHFKSKR